jgi:C1q domain
MSVSSTTNRNNYVGNGSVNEYDYTFRVFDDDDLLVTVRNVAGVETTLTKTTDYTVSGVGLNGGGSITLVSSGQAWLTGGNLTTGFVIAIRRVLDLTQNTDIRNQGDFYPEAHEDQFDRGAMIAQQQQDELDRSLKLSETTDPADFDATLPADAVGAANKVPTLNAAGDGFAPASDWPTSVDIDTATASAAAAAASATLAQDWAVKTDAIVAATDYSSKEYAVGVQRRGLANGGSAKDWATYTGGTVDNAEYSAKYHAQQAALSAASAQWDDVSFKVFGDSPISISDSDAGVLFSVDCTGGNVVINLPSVAGLTLTNPWSVGFKKTDSSANTITINTNGADRFDDGTAIATISYPSQGIILIPDADPAPDNWTRVFFGDLQTLYSPTINTPTTDVVTFNDQASTPSNPAAGFYKYYVKTDGKYYILNSAGVEVAVVTESGTATLTNKTLTGPVIDVINLDDQGSTPATPASGIVKFYAKTNNKVYTLNSAGTETEVGAGGASGINYITNSNAETDTSGYAVYADAAGVVPVDGTGGSPTVTWVRSTTTPLRGTAEFNLVKDAANRQGEGSSYDFTIDSADKGRVLQIGFDYEVVSGTYASGDVTVWVYDVTNAVLLPQPSGNSIISTSIPSQQGQCTFQSAINSTSYRLIFHVTTTSASAYTLAFDNISVGPQISASGAVDTDWITFTPTGSWVSNTTYAGRYRRDGAYADINYYITTTGAPTATGLTVNLPSGLVIDSSKMPDSSPSTGNTPLNANGVVQDVGGNYFGIANAGWLTGGASFTFFTSGSTATTAMTQVSNTVPFTWASGDKCWIHIRIPIVGWGSNTVLSTSGNTRLVDFIGQNTAGNQALTANTTNINFVSQKDTVSGWTGSTYVVQVPGDYQIGSVFTDTASNTWRMDVYVNGTTTNKALGTTSGQRVSGFAVLQNLNVGDIISVRSSGTFSIAGTVGFLYINLLQSPQQIAASEVIAFEANTSNTAATTSAPFIFTNKVRDTHNAYSTSTGVFTAPAPGYYQFNSGVLTSVGSVSLQLYKNGTVYLLGTPISTTVLGIATGMVYMAQGDTMSVRPSGNATGSNSATNTWFNAFRVGGTF